VKPHAPNFDSLAPYLQDILKEEMKLNGAEAIHIGVPAAKKSKPLAMEIRLRKLKKEQL